MEEQPEIEAKGDSGGMDFGEFMQSIEQNMLTMMKETAKAPETAWEHWNAFSAAVDWTETWLRGLLAFHVVLFTIVILTRNSADAQSILFLFVCVMIFLAERINTYCAANWMSFSKQNYFDAHGVFAGILYATPLLIIGLFQLLNFLALASSSLIKAKRLELKHNMKKRSKESEACTTDSSSSKTGSTETSTSNSEDKPTVDASAE